MRMLKSKKGIGPLLAAALLAGVGWIIFKVIIGVSIGKAINQTTLIVVASIFIVALIVIASLKGSGDYRVRLN